MSNLQNFINTIHKNYKLGVCVYDWSGFTVYNDSLYVDPGLRHHHIKFCRAIKDLDGALQCVNDCQKRCQLNEKGFRTCRMGITDFIVPIQIKNQLIGSFVIGQAAINHMSLQVFERKMKKLKVNSKSEIKRLYRNYKDVPIIKQNIFRMVADLSAPAIENIVMKEGERLHKSDTGKSAEKVTFYLWEKEIPLLQSLRSGQKTRAIRELRVLYDNLIKTHENIEVMQAYMLGILDNMVRVVTENGAESGLVNSVYKKVLNVISKANMKTLIEIMAKAVEQLIDMIGEKYLPREKNIVNKAKDTVLQNLQHDITLAEVAKQVGVSLSFLSHVFKKEAGHSFKTYKSEMRIELAKKLLSNSELKLEVVAINSGFKDLAHFSKTFKKLTSLTPSSYRRKILASYT